MSDMMALPKDSPIMLAWEAFQQTEEFANSKKWASAIHKDEHLEGSLWALFLAGWRRNESAAFDVLRKLTFMARTAGATAGADPALQKACEEAEAVIGQKVPPCGRRRPEDVPAPSAVLRETTPQGNVYELRPASGWCVPANVHDSRYVVSFTTGAGTVHVCEACGSHWLVPWEKDPTPTNKVLDDIRRRRWRQVAKHGRALEHDDLHTDGSLAIAAIPYIQSASLETLGLTDEELQVFWPFEEPFRPGKDRREAIENAAALLVAELERVDREAGKTRVPR